MKKQKDGKLVRREKITALAFVSPLIIGFVVFTLGCMVVSFGGAQRCGASPISIRSRVA